MSIQIFARIAARKWRRNRMSDLIDRQAAIDAMAELQGRASTKAELKGISKAWKRIKRLPSAQQEQSTEIQEILEYLDTTLHPIVSPDNWNVYAELHDMVSSLSSAQPERKTGRWIPVDCYSACGGDEVTWMAHGNPTAFYYCSECKEQCYAGEDGESLLTSFCPCCGAKMTNH